ncbi:MAG: hypothetical protein AMXMBFR48_20770 [Ignavibacteriales bacterium]
MAYKHIFISGNVRSEKYRTPSKGGGVLRLPPRERESHSQRLLRQFDSIWHEKEQLKLNRAAQQITTREGTYLSFTSSANNDLITKKMEDLKKGIRLLNIQEIPVDEGQKKIRATIYVPNGKEGHFVKKIEKYQQEDTQTGKPKNKDLVESIEDVSIALLEGLWTDNPSLIPLDIPKWCEVWLNVDSKNNRVNEQIDFFLSTIQSLNIDAKPGRIIFPERAVLLINSNRDQLIELMLQSDLLAELRSGQEPAGFWINESSLEQQAWSEELLSRIFLVDSNIKICLLDTGVNNGHILLSPLIDDANTLTVDPAWGTNDHSSGAGHGTLMAGISGYGKLEDLLVATTNVKLTHKLCSVKIVPHRPQISNPKELWGDITSRAISYAEIQNPKDKLIYCMSITSEEDSKNGRPSSWSGAIDNLTFWEAENKRLIIISAGNVKDQDLWQKYPNSNLRSSVQNPAQSWNAVVVGAYTEKIQVNDLNYKEYIPLAAKGELSPFSTTSCDWGNEWPKKPDVVFEGGNLLRSPDNTVTSHEDLELLSTSKSFTLKQFDTINATSAAAAQAAWFSAKVAYEYPDAWPETIRGLILHSANWNDAMKNQLGVNAGNKADLRRLMKVFGFGIPELDRAIYSQESALTIIAQEIIQPFTINEKGSPTTNEIHIFNLPWPSDLLLNLGGTQVKLRITLSYFVEPGAGEIGWDNKYRYQSHGLRFDLNNIGENELTFRKRINFLAREDEEVVGGNSGSNRWTLGVKNRSSGSIHSDYWESTAAELATCNYIAVYPVIGWWRERKHLGKVESKTRYSLIVSLETPAQEVELYTAVRNLIDIPIEISNG